MNLPTLSAFIRQLTHTVDALEVLHASSPATSVLMEESRAVLGYEIAMLHSLIDDMNAAYAELEDATQEAAFENVGR